MCLPIKQLMRMHLQSTIATDQTWIEVMLGTLRNHDYMLAGGDIICVVR